jgi:hypothetical protein
MSPKLSTLSALVGALLMTACGVPANLQTPSPAPPEDYAQQVRAYVTSGVGTVENLRLTTPRLGRLMRVRSTQNPFTGALHRNEEFRAAGWFVCARYTLTSLIGLRRQWAKHFVFDNQDKIEDMGDNAAAQCHTLPESAFHPADADSPPMPPTQPDGLGRRAPVVRSL